MTFEPTLLRDLIEVSPRTGIVKGKLYPFMDMAAVTEWQRDVPLESLVPREFKGTGSKFQSGDILLARITPCFENGKTAVAPAIPTAGHGSTEFIVIRAKNPEDRAFIYALTRSEDFREHAIRSMVGSSGRQRIPNDALNTYSTVLPAQEYRARASKLLCSIEDLCSSLKGQNTALESIAQTLFRSWFVDFDPVHAKAAGNIPDAMTPELAELFPSDFEDSAIGAIPKGWTASNVGEAFEINPRRQLSKGVLAPFLDMANVKTSGHRPAQPLELKEFGSGTKFMNGDTLLARITPCLENGKTAFVDFLKKGEVAGGSTEFIVIRSKDARPLYWSYLLARQATFRQHAIQAMTGTSGRQRVDVETLKRFGFVCPPRNLVNAVTPIFESIHRLVAGNTDCMTALANLRNHLLPRLISGKLNIGEAEAAVAEVMSSDVAESA